jgi:hypothetical protein
MAMSVASATAAANPAAPYVLTVRDVGAPYGEDQLASGSRALADISVGDSESVQRELRRNWLGGTVAAFRDFSGQESVISIADVFRSSTRIDPVLRAWQQDALRATHGVLVKLPPQAPGQHPALIRGRITDYDVLFYMWSRGKKIASVELTGRPGAPKRRFLLTLARRQDAKLRAT